MSAERFTLDSNVLVYVVDHRDPQKHVIALEIVRRAPLRGCHLTNQCLGEFFWAATRRVRAPVHEVADRMLDFLRAFPSVTTNRSALEAAAREARAGRFAFWDAVFLAAAEEAGCIVALSEDMHDGAR